MRWKMQLLHNVHDLNGVGTLKHLESEIIQENKQKELGGKTKRFFCAAGIDSAPYSILSRAGAWVLSTIFQRRLQNNNTNLINTVPAAIGQNAIF